MPYDVSPKALIQYLLYYDYQIEMKWSIYRFEYLELLVSTNYIISTNQCDYRKYCIDEVT